MSIVFALLLPEPPYYHLSWQVQLRLKALKSLDSRKATAGQKQTRLTVSSGLLQHEEHKLNSIF